MKKPYFSQRLSILAIGCSSVVLASPGVSAAFLTVNNPSFEDPVMSPGGFNSGAGAITDWIVTGSGGVWNPFGVWTGTLGPLPDGVQVGYSNGGTISQTLSDTLQPNTAYTLSIAVGGRTDGLVIGTTYEVNLLVGGSVVASVTPTLPPIGAWTTLDATYTTGNSILSGNLGIEIIANGAQLDFDNVKLESVSTTVGNTVPETSGTYTLASLGLLALAGYSRFRK